MGSTALLEIDFQNWILESAHDQNVAQRARALRDRLRADGAHVFCLRYLDPESRSGSSGTAAAFVPEMLPEAGDLILSKHDRDAFSNPDLAANLALRGIDHLVIVGLLTEHGVQITVRSALRLGYAVSIAAAACAGANTATHQRALQDLRGVGALLF